jgi:hypothetical protein
MTTPCLFCGGDASEPDHVDRCDGRQGRVEAALVSYQAPYAATSETSRDAARSIEPSAPSLCGRIYATLKGPCVAGLTCAEVERLFDLRHQTASARIWDLRTRGFIRDSGLRRRTLSGRWAVVWIVEETAT